MNLRPTNFHEFKGKNSLKDNLKIYIKSALHKKEPLDHCLIYGLPGTGKTTLALIIANEMKAKIKIVQGSSIEKNADLINLILSLEKGDILFIDEIHSMNHNCMELLYSIMEDFVIDIAIGKDMNTKISRLKVPHFTLIGATTMLGNIPLPLEERFGIILNLKEYTPEEIFEIVDVNTNKLKLNLSNEEKMHIVNNTKNIPRCINRVIKRIYDYRCVDPNISINKIYDNLRISHNGLEEDDMLYLKLLNDEKKPIGLKTISNILNIDITTIENKIEPFLLQKKYITKTTGGRLITEVGKMIINY